MRVVSVLVAIVSAVTLVDAQRPAFVPVSEEMLLKPSAEDWLMYSRTYDAQRFSPLQQITTKNVSQLREVFKKELPSGPHESIPIVYRGVMYMLLPGNALQAIDATTGTLIWEHKRPTGASRAKTIAIYEDMVYYATPDGFIAALDARSGEVRWETKTTGGMTAGAIVVEGKVITGRSCAPRRENCYIAAHDAKTGKEVVHRMKRERRRRGHCPAAMTPCAD
jgi:alcohol dehydrogenase (cytochrome c)